MTDPPAMRRILLRGETPELTVETVDEATTEPLERVAERYHAVIPADHMVEAPIVADGIRVAFLTTEFDSFERLRRGLLPGDLLFRPSAVARLDLLRANRKTLVTARALRAGDVIADADLAETLAGYGLDVGMRREIVGRKTLYDMPEGSDVDFGFLSEDPEPGSTATGPRGEVL